MSIEARWRTRRRSTMTGTLVFVHGTGVRQDAYEASVRALRDGAARNGLTGIEVVGCPWGDTLGVPFDAIMPTLPPETVTKSLTAPPTPAEITLATWRLLLDDPLFELRLAGQ